jgi:hypothetical protein
VAKVPEEELSADSRMVNPIPSHHSSIPDPGGVGGRALWRAVYLFGIKGTATSFVVAVPAGAGFALTEDEGVDDLGRRADDFPFSGAVGPAARSPTVRRMR